MTDKPKKTTSQVIREGEKVAKRQRTMKKALRDTGAAKGTYGQAYGRAGIEEALQDAARDERASRGSDDPRSRRDASTKRKNEDYLTRTGEAADAAASIKPPTSDDPTRTNTLPSRVAKAMPNQGLPMVTEDAHLYVGTGMRAHEGKGSSDQAIAERHRKNFDAARAEGDLAGMVQHKQALHNHLNKKGWSTAALCKHDNCGNEVGISDYDKGTVAPEHTAKYADAAAGEAPCRSCLAAGRE